MTEAGKGRQHPFRLRGLREGVAWTPRAWSKATDDTGIGDPSEATPENGARFVDAATRRIADFLIELAAADIEQLYE
jgi:creatinine amidohydrolase